MRLALQIALALSWIPIAVAAAPTPHSPAHLVYVVRPIMEKDALQAVRIEMRFKGSEAGTTVLELPKKWGGKDKLYEALSDFSVPGSNATIEAGSSPWERVLHHRPGASLRIRYVVHHADEGFKRDGNPYRPVILPSRLQLLGSTVFASPHGTASNDTVVVRFEGFPRQWSLASTLERSDLTFEDLTDSTTVAGDFRVLTRLVRGAPLRVAIQGVWPFTDSAFADVLATLSIAEHDFWRDSGEPYLVTLLQLEAPPGSGSSGGTGRSGGFSLFGTPNIGMSSFTRTLAHEMLHTWFPRQIGSMPDDDSRGEAGEYWISEGFDDYYAMRMLVQAGLWTPADFANALNSVLSQYAASPARFEPNSSIVAQFWSNADIRQLPYYRGTLFATLVDQELRTKSGGAHSLDDVMRAMRAHFMSMPQPIRRNFVASVADYGEDIAPRVDDYIENGKPILLAEDTFTACGTISTTTEPRFDLGFNFAATRQGGGTITGVDPELPGYRAGLRDGMVLSGQDSGERGDPMREVALRVIDNGVPRLIRFLPQGRESVEIQSLKLRDGMTTAELNRCAERLGAQRRERGAADAR